jgi:hypothetical protein
LVRVQENREALDKYKTESHGKLKGEIVLITDAKQPALSTRPVFSRYTAERLADIAQAPEPAIRRNITVDQVEIPSDPKEARNYMRTLPNQVEDGVYANIRDFSGLLLREPRFTGARKPFSFHVQRSGR